MIRLLAIGLLSAVAGLAESPSCDVAGEVVNALNGEALRNAAVSATRPSPGVVIMRSGTVGGVQTSESTAPAPALTSQTDDQGRFCLSGLPPGLYDLSAKRPGFLDREYDARGRVRPGPQVRVARGSTLEKQVIRLTPQGVVAGRVYDQEGQPVPKATIRLYRLGYVRGQKRMIPAASAESDNRGEFRIASVPPGKYYVAALPPTGAAPGATTPAPTFYPGATDLGRASQFEISPGLERSGVDLRLISTEAFRISGKVLDGAGKPVGRAVMSALEPVVLWRPGAARVMTGEDGAFQLSGVPRGTYSVSAYRSPDGYIARQTVEVTGDVTGLEMRSVPATQVVGSMVFEDGRKLPLNAVRILLQRVDPAVFESVYGEVQADGRFTLANVRPGRFRFNAAGLEDDWYVVAVRGVPTADNGDLDFTRLVPGTMEVVLGAVGGRLSGVVRHEEKALEAAVIALFPVDYARQPHWRLRLGTSKRKGEFAITGIAPGEYKLLAWQDAEHGAVEDREFLKEHAGRAVSVSVAAGQRIELSPPVVAAQR